MVISLAVIRAQNFLKDIMYMCVFRKKKKKERARKWKGQLRKKNCKNSTVDGLLRRGVCTYSSGVFRRIKRGKKQPPLLLLASRPMYI